MEDRGCRLCTTYSSTHRPHLQGSEEDEQDTSISWCETKRRAQLHLHTSEKSVAFIRTSRVKKTEMLRGIFNKYFSSAVSTRFAAFSFQNVGKR
jgi:hypothetical protein